MVELQENLEIANLQRGVIYPVNIPSLELEGRMFYLCRDKVASKNPKRATSDYEHLIFVDKPTPRNVSISLDARLLKIVDGTVMEKEPFSLLDFGVTWGYVGINDAERTMAMKSFEESQ